MVGTQPLRNGDKRWHFEKKRNDKKGTGEESVYIFYLNFRTRNIGEWVKTSHT